LDEVNASLALIEETDRHLDDLSVAWNDRHEIALKCLHLTLEHANACLLLVQHGFIGTAAALRRVTFESYIRGLWVFRVASDSEIQSFRKDKVPKISELLSGLEKIPFLYKEYFEAVRTKHLRIMHSLTHTGIAQLVHRRDKDEIAANYSEDTCLEIVQWASGLRMNAAVTIYCIGNRRDLAEEVIGLHKKL
jgi:hypothetical protein